VIFSYENEKSKQADLVYFSKAATLTKNIIDMLHFWAQKHYLSQPTK